MTRFFNSETSLDTVPRCAERLDSQVIMSPKEGYVFNPTLIYDGLNYGSAPLIPIIFMHDGSGTTFSYHRLDPPNRPLYGISNIRFDAGGWWEGGISQMARNYINLLEEAIPGGGDIILGGWSLGGILSLEMAHQLATDPTLKSSFRVVGMIFIDSVCPSHISSLPWSAYDRTTKRMVESHQKLGAMGLKEKIDLNILHALIMAQQWEKPQWKSTRAPPAILLRAKDPVEDRSDLVVDHLHDDRLLGWSQYNEEQGNFIREVVDVGGHHFSIFEDKYITDISTKICAAADLLDNMSCGICDPSTESE